MFNGKIYTAPQTIKNSQRKSIFLAGSIEMGKAVKWQAETALKLSECFDVYNPRREDWDSSWEQKAENPHFYQQVNWELNAMKVSDVVLFYFDPDTISPVSMLELGLFWNKAIVVCPEGFHRKGNIDIVCSTFKITTFESLSDAINLLVKGKI